MRGGGGHAHHDTILVSIDDHMIEPPDLCEKDAPASLVMLQA